MVIEVDSFNDIIKYFELNLLKTFNKNTKSISDLLVKCYSDNIDYLLSIDIDRSVKMKQLRTMYLNQEEIDRVKSEMIKYSDFPNDYQVIYNFNNVGGKEISTHHKKGGCLTKITFTFLKGEKLEIQIDFRASVVPYNLYYDLIMLHNLFKELGLDQIKIDKVYYFNFNEVKGKLMQNFFYYISAGYYDLPENFVNFEYGKMMVEEYNKAENSSYHSTKRFWGKCNDAMEKRRDKNGK